MSDLTKYVKARAARDAEFADGLESGYAEFKVDALLRQDRLPDAEQVSLPVSGHRRAG